MLVELPRHTLQSRVAWNPKRLAALGRVILVALAALGLMPLSRMAVAQAAQVESQEIADDLTSELPSLPAAPAGAEGADPPAGGQNGTGSPDRGRAAAASIEDLYDFKAFSDDDPRFKAAQDAFRKRQWRDAVQKAQESLGVAANPALVRAAQLIVAMAQEQLKNFADAERAWQPLAQAGPLAQRARQHLADLAMRRGDVQQALAQLAAIAPWHVSRDAATLQMAQLELGRGQIGPARDALERVHPALLTQEQQAILGYLQGEVARRSGHNDVAVAQFLRAWNLDQGPWSDRSAKKLGELQAAPSPADQIERILRRREAQPGQLRTWLHEAEVITEEASGLRAYVHGALLGRDKKQRKKAIELLLLAVERLSEPLLQGRALYALGDLQGKDGQNDQAIETLKKINELAAGDEVKARALQRLHRLWNAVDQPAEAQKALETLLASHPQAEEKELALWGLAWQKFGAADFSGALRILVQLDKEYGHLYTGAQQSWRAKAIYWQGRCLQQMGQTQAAMEAWSTVAQTWAQTYYGVIALDRIAEVDGERAVRIQGPPPSPAAMPSQPPSLARLRVQRSRDLDEAAQLLRAGLAAEAKTLLRAQLAKGLPRDGVHLLATLYDLEGQRKQAFGVMQRHTRRAARPDDSTASAWRQSFPRAFHEEVVASSQRADIPKTFLYAIMRHESGFNPTAASKAGAYGLVQLIEPAAKTIAELYKMPVMGRGGLFRPSYNLTVGGLYLAQLLGFYRNNAAMAAAAYNAGPRAVQAWHGKWAGQPTDAFVESIPYPATRAYVMQVLASAQTYAWLYPEWGEMERDRLARAAQIPQTLGPFLQKPQATAMRVD